MGHRKKHVVRDALLLAQHYHCTCVIALVVVPAPGLVGTAKMANDATPTNTAATTANIVKVACIFFIFAIDIENTSI
jgi:hypothetical protein